MKSATTTRVTALAAPMLILAVCAATAWMLGFHKSAIIGGLLALLICAGMYAGTGASEKTTEKENRRRHLSPEEVREGVEQGRISDLEDLGDWRENNAR